MIVIEAGTDETFFYVKRRLKFENHPDRFNAIATIYVNGGSPNFVTYGAESFEAVEMQTITNKINEIIYLNYRKLADQEKK